MLFLVAYDIANQKRLRRVAKLMESYGTRVQRSIFECRLTQLRLEELILAVKSVIKQRQDKVQIYHICSVCQQRFAEFKKGTLVEDLDVYIC